MFKGAFIALAGYRIIADQSPTLSETCLPPKTRGGLMARDLDRLRKKLEYERAELLDSLSHYEVVARSKKPGLGNHMADDGTAAFDQAADMALNRNQRILLEKVERALCRMDKGTYGLCERCNEKIDFARLKAVPYATLCIRCQQHAETPSGNGGRQ